MYLIFESIDFFSCRTSKNMSSAFYIKTKPPYSCCLFIEKASLVRELLTKVIEKDRRLHLSREATSAAQQQDHVIE